MEYNIRKIMKFYPIYAHTKIKNKNKKSKILVCLCMSVREEKIIFLTELKSQFFW